MFHLYPVPTQLLTLCHFSPKSMESMPNIWSSSVMVTSVTQLGFGRDIQTFLSLAARSLMAMLKAVQEL